MRVCGGVVLVAAALLGIWLWSSGGDSPQLHLERRFGRWMHMESSLLCQSGYAANVGLIQAIGAPGTPVYVDMFAHASLWEGVRSAGLEWKPFRHNDASHLETMISRNGPGIVVVGAAPRPDPPPRARLPAIEPWPKQSRKTKSFFKPAANSEPNTAANSGVPWK